MKSRPFCSFFIFFVLSPFSVLAQKIDCANIGNTITVRGSITPGINGGTYFVPLRRVCVRYPKQTDRFTPTNLITIGDKLPPNTYVEVTGELSDPWPVMGVGIKVKSFKNVDAEVRQALADWRLRCEKWQDENIPALKERTHGGNVARIQNSDEVSSLPGHQCGIAAADTKLPHGSVTIWRTESAHKEVK